MPVILLLNHAVKYCLMVALKQDSVNAYGYEKYKWSRICKFVTEEGDLLMTPSEPGTYLTVCHCEDIISCEGK